GYFAVRRRKTTIAGGHADRVSVGAVALDRSPVLLAGLGDRCVFGELTATRREHERRARSRLSDHDLTRSFDLDRLYVVVGAGLTGPITHRGTDTATCSPSPGR